MSLVLLACFLPALSAIQLPHLRFLSSSTARLPPPRAVADAAALSEDAARQASFEEAQELGAKLATILSASCAAGEPMPEEAVPVLRALVSSTSGSRGWFVSLLTAPDFEPIFQPPLDDAMLDAICESPEPNVKLMTMNVAMSTATELTHLERGSEDMAAASRMTARRSTALMVALLDRLPGLRESAEALLTAVDPNAEAADADWLKFCKKWGYGATQREAIRKRLAAALAE